MGRIPTEDGGQEASGPGATPHAHRGMCSGSRGHLQPGAGASDSARSWGEGGLGRQSQARL